MEFYKELSTEVPNLMEAPELIRVLPFGYILSESGGFVVDDESFYEMNENMRSRNIDIVIDYEHQTLKNIQAPASGWIKELYLKSDGIYAKVEWTNKAKHYLYNKEFRYFSPIVLIRKKDHKILKLHSAALTNAPTINGMIPIANSTNTSLENDQKWILRMCNISEDDFYNYSIGRFQDG